MFSDELNAVLPANVTELTETDVIAMANEVVVTYAQAAEILDLHPTYARRIMEAAATEESYVQIGDHTYLLRSFVVALREARIEEATAKAADLAERQALKNANAAAKAERLAEREAAKNAPKPEKAPKAPKAPKEVKAKKAKTAPAETTDQVGATEVSDNPEF